MLQRWFHLLGFLDSPVPCPNFPVPSLLPPVPQKTPTVWSLEQVEQVAGGRVESSRIAGALVERTRSLVSGFNHSKVEHSSSKGMQM